MEAADIIYYAPIYAAVLKINKRLGTGVVAQVRRRTHYTLKYIYMLRNIIVQLKFQIPMPS